MTASIIQAKGRDGQTRKFWITSTRHEDCLKYFVHPQQDKATDPEAIYSTDLEVDDNKKVITSKQMSGTGGYCELGIPEAVILHVHADTGYAVHSSRTGDNPPRLPSGTKVWLRLWDEHEAEYYGGDDHFELPRSKSQPLPNGVEQAEVLGLRETLKSGYSPTPR